MRIRSVAPDYLSAAAVVGVTIVIAVVGRLSDGSRATTESAALVKASTELVHQAAEWHRMAQQDTSPLFALRHAALAVAYLSAARLAVSDAAIQKSTGVDIHRALQTFEGYLRKRTQTIGKKCKGLQSREPTSVTWL